eukprot:03605.XXX_140234_140539_1 [CDS] Oithona nana genome sequencing.
MGLGVVSSRIVWKTDKSGTNSNVSSNTTDENVDIWSPCNVVVTAVFDTVVLMVEVLSSASFTAFDTVVVFVEKSGNCSFVFDTLLGLGVSNSMIPNSGMSS